MREVCIVLWIDSNMRLIWVYTVARKSCKCPLVYEDVQDLVLELARGRAFDILAYIPIE